MNKRQQEQYIYFFDELCQAQQVIDKLKHDLLHRQSYNPHLLFELISQGHEQIKISQLRNYLNDKIACSHRQLYELFEKFDSKRNGFITRLDFIRELTPFKTKVHFDHRNGTLNAQIQSSFLEIIIEILKRFRIIQQSRKQIGFILPYEAFAHLDYWKKGIIGLDELHKFYRDNDFQIPQSSIEFLLHALRRRYHHDVNLQLFCQNLNPLQLGQYAGFAQQIDKEKEQQFLKRSRVQQEAMKRSRVQNQLMEYEIQRAQRRKKAQIQRQLNMEERINLELSDYDRQQQQLIQRALLQEERRIRNNISAQSSVLDRDYIHSIQQSRRIRQLQTLRQQERLRNSNIQRQLASRQAILNSSIKKSQVQREIHQQKEQARQVLARSRQLQLSRQRQQSLRDKETLFRQLERERLLKGYQQTSNRTAKQSKIQELELQLERTRAQMRERRERLQLQDKMRLLQSSTKSKLSAFPY